MDVVYKSFETTSLYKKITFEACNSHILVDLGSMKIHIGT